MANSTANDRTEGYWPVSPTLSIASITNHTNDKNSSTSTTTVPVETQSQKSYLREQYLPPYIRSQHPLLTVMHPFTQLATPGVREPYTPPKRNGFCCETHRRMWQEKFNLKGLIERMREYRGVEFEELDEAFWEEIGEFWEELGRKWGLGCEGRRS